MKMDSKVTVASGGCQWVKSGDETPDKEISEKMVGLNFDRSSRLFVRLFGSSIPKHLSQGGNQKS